MSQHAPYIWSYFIKKIQNPFGVAGLMGNLEAESSLMPNRVQGYSTDDSYNATYTAQVDSGVISENAFVNNGPNGGGYGLAQWTYYTRKQALYDMYKTGGYSSIGSIELACDYLYYELKNSYPSVLSTLKKATSLREASDCVLHDFESPADQSTSVEVYRAGLGQVHLSTYGGTYGNPEEIAIIDKAVNRAVSIANDNTHGYENYGGGPDYDCVSLLEEAWSYAGLNISVHDASSTKYFKETFEKIGFNDVTSLINFSTGEGLLRGDILLNPDYHVEMMVDSNTRVGAHSNYDGVTGDSGGTEIDIGPYANYATYGWTYCLRYGEGYGEIYIPPTKSKRLSKLLLYAVSDELF